MIRHITYKKPNPKITSKIILSFLETFSWLKTGRGSKVIKKSVVIPNATLVYQILEKKMNTLVKCRAVRSE